ncbi:helix-turn-helix domain-containing protein [Leptolyngbya sp. FACHB-541]|uniref:nucleotide exchange factor GrpE n=1 Tax=Leptolyngbya sp. FACHB-541 TaxID=2692810 RepID=UPI001689F563|nr:helix-turn-helix domain-containing protein [Leptolyngbya sp. FACHB-541]MBD1996774.1 helix-turn-helix domain-containing protein [Leptolyngbya sp. FACHB-541]
MNQTSNSNHSDLLRSLMQPLNIPSFKALSRTADVSEWQVKQLRQGRAAQMQAEPLFKLSQTLQISLNELLAKFSNLPLPSSEPNSTQNLGHLQQEYRRLEAQLAEQQRTLQQEFQRSSLQTLESLLLQLPTATYAAENNPQIPAARLLPLLRPIEQLLKSWGVEAIAPVGSEVAYDPQLHQLMEGWAESGDRVKIRYTGYIQGKKLLYRAKVSPVSNP